ncbi:MAG: hypothetical protein E7523_08660 [Ruminococcaceae bacterium]|nr:hypothetical protein [Oscillospiraceae bacterium]
MRSNEEQTKLILEKYENHKTKKRKKTKIITACISVAACLVSVFGIGSIMQHEPDLPPDNNNFPVNTQLQTTEKESNSATAESGVYIPEIKIEPVEENVMADMLAMVKYNDRIYVGHYLWDHPMEYNEHKDLLGEYVGTGNNKITCWSDEKDYEGQFASNTPYNFYTVKGYDPVFRLAAVMHLENGSFIEFFDCLNGIWLQTGTDLYEDLLHITDNYTSVLYQLHNDWDYGKGNYKQLDTVTDSDIKAFIETLKASEFVDLTDTASAHEIYNGKQAHLFFQMHDGTTLGIRLFEGGYVEFAGTSARAYVYMPGEIFDVIFNATT